jgi:hypothetical protein
VPIQRPPVIVGGTGGSGTRVVATLLTRAGVYMGRRLNNSMDSMDFESFFTDHIPDVLGNLKQVDYRLDQLPQEMIKTKLEGLHAIMKEFRAQCPENARAWGFKNPRSIYLVPFFKQLYPNMAFVHVVRDGRDMAFSTNQNQLLRLYGPLYGHELPADWQAASATMWQKVNIERTRWALRYMPGRYFVLRFEDLCAQPETEARRLLNFLGLSMDDEALRNACSKVKPPESIGRYKTLPPARQEELTRLARTGLILYNYLPL